MQKSRTTNLTVEGVIHDEIMFGKTYSGKEYAQFVLEDKNTRHLCKAYKGAVTVLGQLDKGIHLFCKGFKKDDDPTVLVMEVIPSGSQESWLDKEIQKAGGKDAFTARRKEKLKERADAGYVMCRDLDDRRYWDKKEYCTDIRGFWERKIEFVMHVMGARVVTRVIRSAGVSERTGKKAVPILEDLFNKAIGEYGNEGIKIKDTQPINETPWIEG